MSISINRLHIKAKMFRGFGDPTRLSILEILRDGEKSVSEITLQLKQNQPNISNHLSCLKDCGLVKSKRRGKNIYYSLASNDISLLLEYGDNVIEDFCKGIYECMRYNNE